MPDPIIMAQGIVAAALAAAALLLLVARPWNAASLTATHVGSTLAVALGVAAGGWLLDLKPAWPPTEDVHRLLAIVLPAAAAVELIAAIPKVPGAVAWALRAVVAFGAARVLLDGSTYIADLFGPGSAEWNETQRLQIFGALGAGILAVQAGLLGLAQRRPSRAIPAALAFAAGGAALTVMLSGYATGGQLGLALGGALMAVAIASLFLKETPALGGGLAVGVVVLGSLLISGRFFGELTTAHLAMILGAPLLCWVTEIPGLSKLGPKTRGAIQIVLVAGLVGFAVFQAQQEFVKNSQSVPASEYDVYSG